MYCVAIVLYKVIITVTKYQSQSILFWAQENICCRRHIAEQINIKAHNTHKKNPTQNNTKFSPTRCFRI